MQHTKRRHLQKYEKRYVHYSLLIVQILKLLTIQYNTYASYKFDTVYYLQHLHCLQYNTYGTYNTILILLIIPYLYYLRLVFTSDGVGVGVVSGVVRALMT